MIRELKLKKDKLDFLSQCGFGPKIMKQIKVCPHCGTIVNGNHSVCPDCGMRILTKTLYDRYLEKHLCCDKCGTVLTLDSRYCPHCGRSLYLNDSRIKKGGNRIQKFTMKFINQGVRK